MENFWLALQIFFQRIELYAIFKALLLLIAGFTFARVLSNYAHKFLGRYAPGQQTLLLQKTIYFVVLILFCIAGLQELGFRLSVILGSAGIATAAIAIASQTSISNIVSGIFLILEKSFQIGDGIKIGNTSGTITSIDLLSVKILTANNTLIRIPNETLIKSEITNITRFEMRRLEINIDISYKENVKKVKELLLSIAQHNALCLKNPLPRVIIADLNNSGVTLQLLVWALQKEHDELKNQLLEEIKSVFESNEILLPIPAQEVHVAGIDNILSELHKKNR